MGKELQLELATALLVNGVRGKKTEPFSIPNLVTSGVLPCVFKSELDFLEFYRFTAAIRYILIRGILIAFILIISIT